MKMLKHIGICVVLYLSAVSAVTIDDEDVQYYLYTPTNPTPVQFGLPMNIPLNIDPSKPVKVLCHGYIDNSSSMWIEPIKNAYMTKGSVNVIVVDWSELAFGTYDEVFFTVPAVGDHVGRMVLALSQIYNISLLNFHLAGHSLGSHISGFAGKKITKVTNQKIARITGLDPAGPLYDVVGSNDRLSLNDAIFVDAIHTDLVGLGYKLPIAHVDFWPNGGLEQPGCGLIDKCSHCRAPLYFAESIGSSFISWECSNILSFYLGLCRNNDKAFMGENCNSTTRGNFYLRTNGKSPFAIKSK